MTPEEQFSQILREHPEILEFANDLVLRLLHKSDLENSAF